MSADSAHGAGSRFEDYLSIQNALALYVTAIDTRDLALFDLCFTPDAQIQLSGVGDGPMSPATYRQLSEAGLAALDATQHHLSLPLIEIDGDRAHARCYFMAQHVRNALAPSPFLMIGGWYTDDLIRTEQGWRITRRTGTALWFDGNPQVLGYDFPGGASPRGGGHLAPGWLAGAG